ncbi:hypothetical protein JHK82_055399 [Glycine max]|nr:hypothetical protein JHK86_055236 [Glycine max]KAG4917942.1 hypothetical protein JHK85_056223 [Glycine max]KAG5074035.1 hypothetical protein JHK84_055266 [Glycine max]KAG5076704.1 hypothetical protein JHK82_055399 [Glycine max]
MGCYRIEGRDPTLHRVGGGRYTWSPKVNFTKWASHEHFYKGDWLYFGFDKRIYNVLEVNKTNYENCIDTGFIENITRGGRDVFQLLEARHYYFICGRGFCSQGMKLLIDVKEPTTTLPPPILPNKALLNRLSNTLMLVVTILAWIFI